MNAAAETKIDWLQQIINQKKKSIQEKVTEKLNRMTEQDLKEYNEWLTDVWSKQIRIPFMIDAPKAYLDYKSKALNVQNVSKTFCDNCKSGLIDYPELNRRTCRCGALGYNVC